MDRDEDHPEDQRKFVEKWSQNIFDNGAFTMVPNALLGCADMIGISPSELVILINIESFRWANKLPYPSVQRLAIRTGMSERHVTRLITSLVKKGLIRRNRRKSRTNEYDLYPLIAILDGISETVPDNIDTTTRQNEPVEADIIDTEIPTPKSAKEDTFKQDLVKHIRVNNSLRINSTRVDILDIKNRYGGYV